jgi:hypothetical protein
LRAFAISEAPFTLRLHRAHQDGVYRSDAGGALMNTTADSPDAQAEIRAFTQGLQELGWTIGRDVLIDYRWGAAGLLNRDRKRERNG